MSRSIGIMQGRLSPAGARAQSFPSVTWRDEFAQAHRLGFDCIEWLVTAESVANNPLLHDVSAIRAVARSTRIDVETVCADCFIERPLVRGNEQQIDASFALLDRLIAQASAVGARTVVLPLLEDNAVSRTATPAALWTRLSEAGRQAEERGLRLAIESDLPARTQRESVAAAGLHVCYDIGNATAAGEDLGAAITTLGDRICSVHVKDRRRGGASVPLGSGDTDFSAAFAAFRAIAYAGPLILETPRGDAPLDAARDQLAFVRRIASSRAFVA